MAWRRVRRWQEEGVWERIWRTLLARLDAHGKLDWTTSFLDGSGTPIDFHLDSANKAEVRLAEQTLRSIRVPRPAGDAPAHGLSILRQTGAMTAVPFGSTCTGVVSGRASWLVDAPPAGHANRAAPLLLTLSSTPAGCL